MKIEQRADWSRRDPPQASRRVLGRAYPAYENPAREDGEAIRPKFLQIRVRRAAASEDDNSRRNFQIPLKVICNAPDTCSMEVRSDPFDSAKSHFFDTSTWGAFCDVTLTLKQARQPDSGGWVKLDDYRCRQAFRHFDGITLENLVRDCWAKVAWGYGRHSCPRW